MRLIVILANTSFSLASSRLRMSSLRIARISSSARRTDWTRSERARALAASSSVTSALLRSVFFCSISRCICSMALAEHADALALGPDPGLEVAALALQLLNILQTVVFQLAVELGHGFLKPCPLAHARW